MNRTALSVVALTVGVIITLILFFYYYYGNITHITHTCRMLILFVLEGHN